MAKGKKKIYQKYEEELPEKLLEETKKETKDLNQKQTEKVMEEVLKEYKKRQVEPGEAAGAIAAQSIGERATQMTLKTFHVAGLSEGVSVVQGLPRLEELIETRKTPKKEVCRIRPKKEIEKNKEKVVKIAKKIEETKTNDIGKVEEDLVEEKIIIKPDMEKIEKLGIEMNEIAEKIKEKIRRKPEKIEKDKIIFKPKASTLKSLRRYVEKAENTRIIGIEGIEKATLVEKEENGETRYEIHTDGSNLKEVLKTDDIDPEKTDSNSIPEIYKTLGIEATRKMLYKELMEITEEYNINKRHILLISDALTRSGRPTPIGRHGISGEKESVLARAAFEEQIKHLLKAAQKGEKDELKGVAENIIVGNPIPVGTGMVDLRIDLEKQKN